MVFPFPSLRVSSVSTFDLVCAPFAQWGTKSSDKNLQKKFIGFSCHQKLSLSLCALTVDVNKYLSIIVANFWLVLTLFGQFFSTFIEKIRSFLNYLVAFYAPCSSEGYQKSWQKLAKKFNRFSCHQKLSFRGSESWGCEYLSVVTSFVQ